MKAQEISPKEESLLLVFLRKILNFFFPQKEQGEIRYPESLLNRRNLNSVGNTRALEILEILAPDAQKEDWEKDDEMSHSSLLFIKSKKTGAGIIVGREGVFFCKDEYIEDPRPYSKHARKKVFAYLLDANIDIKRILSNAFMVPGEEKRAFQQLCSIHRLESKNFIPAEYLTQR
ncbi:hypothetical protein H6776_00765 [Candidatus Nomurabacteria bacterium]|nr:hypothetical protein [Candidatus Nomurabacteria bacterium]